MNREFRRHRKNKNWTTDKVILYAAEILVRDKLSLREVSPIVGVSRSCLSENFGQRLRFLDYDLYLKVRQRLELNSQTMHMKGGLVTKAKYEKLRKEKEVKKGSLKNL